jgi:hypothetical protein
MDFVLDCETVNTLLLIISAGASLCISKNSCKSKWLTYTMFPNKELN